VKKKKKKKREKEKGKRKKGKMMSKLPKLPHQRVKVRDGEEDGRLPDGTAPRKLQHLYQMTPGGGGRGREKREREKREREREKRGREREREKDG